ncbi:hypothetical protein BDV27DRAFT_134703, partial [Aspergillus caelatus]
MMRQYDNALFLVVPQSEVSRGLATMRLNFFLSFLFLFPFSLALFFFLFIFFFYFYSFYPSIFPLPFKNLFFL